MTDSYMGYSSSYMASLPVDTLMEQRYLCQKADRADAPSTRKTCACASRYWACTKELHRRGINWDAIDALEEALGYNG